MGNGKSSSHVTTSRYINGKYGSVVVKIIRDNQVCKVIELNDSIIAYPPFIVGYTRN